jgi:hypothetical protein
MMGDNSGFGPPVPPPPGGGGPAVPPPPGGGGDTLQPRRFGEIFQAAFDIYKNNAQKLLLVVAIIVVPLSIVSYLIARVALAAKKTSETISGITIQTVEPRSWFIAVLAGILAIAIGLIITSLLTAATLRAAALATIGDPVDIEASYQYGLKRFGSVLLVSVLIFLAVLVGFFLLFVGAIIAGVLFSVAIPAVVVENRRGTEAMKRSWNLVKGQFWHVLGVILVANILAGIVVNILTAIGSANTILGLILNIIGEVITAPFLALVTVVLYLDLRARLESLTTSTLRTELSAGA